MPKLKVNLRRPHPQQAEFLDDETKRKVLRAGRRSGKTTAVAIQAVQEFLRGGRVLYAVPTVEQIERFWYEVKQALCSAVDAGVFYKNESSHIVGLKGTEQRIRAKTAWNADSLRGDFADLLILDEFQSMNEDTWQLVGAPMLLDNDGNAVLVYTPPSAASVSFSKARDVMHAAKLFKKAAADTTGRWKTFHFTSHDNPYISTKALDDVAGDMSARAYRQEILAEDIDSVPGALWTFDMVEALRVFQAPKMSNVVVAWDPATTSTTRSDEHGIIICGRGLEDKPAGYVLGDVSGIYTPDEALEVVLKAVRRFDANRIIAETNQGGDMISSLLRTKDISVPYTGKAVSASKRARAEPVSAMYEQGRVRHVGIYTELERQMTTWQGPPGPSPNRLDALVQGISFLFGLKKRRNRVRIF